MRVAVATLISFLEENCQCWCLTPLHCGLNLTLSVYYPIVKTCMPFLCKLPGLLHALQQTTHNCHQRWWQASTLIPPIMYSPIQHFIPFFLTCITPVCPLTLLWWSIYFSIPHFSSFNTVHLVLHNCTPFLIFHNLFSYRKDFTIDFASMLQGLVSIALFIHCNMDWKEGGEEDSPAALLARVKGGGFTF